MKTGLKLRDLPCHSALTELDGFDLVVVKGGQTREAWASLFADPRTNISTYTAPGNTFVVSAVLDTTGKLVYQQNVDQYGALQAGYVPA